VKACPPITAEAANGSPRFEPNWRTLSAQTRVASPSMLVPLSFARPRSARCGLGLSLGLRRGTGSLGQVGRPVSGTTLHVHAFVTVSVFFPSELPVGFLKGISSVHHRFAETRKGAPTNWAGTPDAPHLEISKRFAKPFFSNFTAKRCKTGLSYRPPSKIETSVPPSHRGPSWTISQPD